uniref:Isoform 2 of Pleckstrin homology domain-containing family B member 2 n=1 Tax=Homo sapiens TaxID=9606 RepID=Q96CS7-2
MAFVKSGWLLRQSTILKRWKKNWFDLWSDGHLIYYDDQTRQNIEDKVHMPMDCINIRTGQECRDTQPPDGKSKDCMLQIVCRDGKTISLCAESTDDCLAWKFTLQDSRTNTAYVGSAVMTDETSVVSSPPPYTAYAAPAPEELHSKGPKIHTTTSAKTQAVLPTRCFFPSESPIRRSVQISVLLPAVNIRRRIKLTFPQPARPRAPRSLCLWQTWFAGKRAPSLPTAATAPALPSCPSPPAPSKALPPSLAGWRSPSSAPLPPEQALAPRSFQLSKHQARPRPHRPGTPPVPAWPGVPPPPPARPPALR